MKFIIAGTILFTSMIFLPKSIPSKVFNISRIKAKNASFGEVKSIAIGKTRDFQNMDISLITLNQKGQYEVSPSGEKLIIIQSGRVVVNINSQEYELGAGSVVVAGNDENISIKNSTIEKANLYLFLYQSSAKNSSEEDFQPIVKDWQQIEFKPHDKGGIRNFFDTETNECIRFEMHVTNLNAGIKSHEPHTHRAGEFVLMMKGNTEMEIGGEIYKGSVGDLYFLESEVSHAIKNIGTEQCQYFAFQME